MMNAADGTIHAGGTGIRIGLWIAQSLVFVVFVMAGFLKLTTPIAELSKMLPWTGQLPMPFVRFMGLIDLAGGIGILLPALTRIKPRVTIWAAMCCSVLQVCAAVFHTWRGEAALTPLNYVLLSLALFVWWGRGKRAPIIPR